MGLNCASGVATRRKPSVERSGFRFSQEYVRHLQKGSLMFTARLSKSYWTVFMNGISVDESRTINTSLIAVSFSPLCLLSECCPKFTNFSPEAIDTGTSLIYVPDSVANDFYAQARNSSPVEDADGEFPAQIPGSRRVTQFGPSMNSIQGSTRC